MASWGLGALLMGSSLVAAQSDLEKLEGEVKRRVARDAERQADDEQADADRVDGDGDKRGAAADRKEPGYLGVVADDRIVPGRGVSIVKVVQGGPADQAGLRADDLMIAVNGQEIHDMQEFGEAVSAFPPGAKLIFTFLREDDELELEITLGDRPAARERLFDEFGPVPDDLPEPGPGARGGLLGIRIGPVDQEVQDREGLPSARGAVITSVVPGSPADMAGLRPGSVIVALDGRRVDQPDDLERLVNAAGPGRKIKLKYYIEGRAREKEVQLAAEEELPGPNDGNPDGDGANPGDGGPRLGPAPGDDPRFEVLERRIVELEARVAELERALARRAKNPADAPRPERPPR